MPSHDERKDLVRRGYDNVSKQYRGDDDRPETYVEWIETLSSRLRPAAQVLDLGCGCGMPVAHDLAAAGHQVTGVDISDVQIERARLLVPDAQFLRGDAATVNFAPRSFDAVVCLYTIIHLPLVEQPLLLANIAGWLRPKGWLLLVAGHTAWTGIQKRWLDGDTTMWWSQADRNTYRRWINAAGMEVVDEKIVPDGGNSHVLFWAHREAGSSSQ